MAGFQAIPARPERGSPHGFEHHPWVAGDRSKAPGARPHADGTGHDPSPARASVHGQARASPGASRGGNGDHGSEAIRGGFDYPDPLAGPRSRLNRHPDHIFMDGERADEGREDPALVSSRPGRGIGGVCRTIDTLDLEGACQFPDAMALQLHREIIQGGSRALGPLQGGVAVQLKCPAPDPLAGGLVERAFAHHTGGPAGAAAEHRPGESSREQFDRRSRHRAAARRGCSTAIGRTGRRWRLPTPRAPSGGCAGTRWTSGW